MRRIVVVALSLFAGLAEAGGKPVVKADTREAFAAVAADVRREMGEGGRYAYVTSEERTRIEADLDAMTKLFAAHASVGDMDRSTRVQLFNAQEDADAILELRDRDRLVCERNAGTGSRIVSTHCRTVGEIEAARQAGERFMQQKTATPCNAPSCTGK